MYRLTVDTFKGSEKSFISALTAEGVTVNKVMLLSERPMAAGNRYSVIANIAEAMPWNAIAKVIVAWIEARASREVNFILKDHGPFMAKGYSVKEVENMLKKAHSITAIDTKPNE